MTCRIYSRLRLVSCVALMGLLACLIAGPLAANHHVKARLPQTVGAPTLEIIGLSPASPVKFESWGVRYRLTHSSVRTTPLTGWIQAVAFDVADTARTRAIRTQSVPIANLQPGNAQEGSLVLPTTGDIEVGRVEVTYFDITGGYAAPAANADSVVPDVPARVKRRLLHAGLAKPVSRAQSDFTLSPTEADRFAAVFDFDDDSCYPSPAVLPNGDPNPGQSVAVTNISHDCRNPEQLQSATTYYRKASVRQNGIDYAVHMYALYFMKDKTARVATDAGHRHDWEFALVWTMNGEITHASFSHHGKVTTRPKSRIEIEVGASEHVKFVYHKDLFSTGGVTHAMRFAKPGEQAENHQKRWIRPSIVEWNRMTLPNKSNEELRHILNVSNFGEADCSVNDQNFRNEITKSLPSAYPVYSHWLIAAQ